jgi:hypothetical protein
MVYKDIEVKSLETAINRIFLPEDAPLVFNTLLRHIDNPDDQSFSQINLKLEELCRWLLKNKDELIVDFQPMMNISLQIRQDINLWWDSFRSSNERASNIKKGFYVLVNALIGGMVAQYFGVKTMIFGLAVAGFPMGVAIGIGIGFLGLFIYNCCNCGANDISSTPSQHGFFKREENLHYTVSDAVNHKTAAVQHEAQEAYQQKRRDKKERRRLRAGIARDPSSSDLSSSPDCWNDSYERAGNRGYSSN